MKDKISKLVKKFIGMEIREIKVIKEAKQRNRERRDKEENKHIKGIKKNFLWETRKKKGKEKEKD